MKIPKLNVRLLRRIQKHILKEPRRFFMEGVMVKFKNQKQWDEATMIHSDLSPIMPPCGTAACIAGWANILSGRGSKNLSVAAKTLGLSEEYDFSGTTCPADRVFAVMEWPQPFQDQYEQAKTPRRRARIATNRIEHLIKTGQ